MCLCVGHLLWKDAFNKDDREVAHSRSRREPDKFIKKNKASTNAGVIWSRKTETFATRPNGSRARDILETYTSEIFECGSFIFLFRSFWGATLDRTTTKANIIKETSQISVVYSVGKRPSPPRHSAVATAAVLVTICVFNGTVVSPNNIQSSFGLLCQPWDDDDRSNIICQQSQSPAVRGKKGGMFRRPSRYASGILLDSPDRKTAEM